MWSTLKKAFNMILIALTARGEKPLPGIENQSDQSHNWIVHRRKTWNFRFSLVVELVK